MNFQFLNFQTKKCCREDNQKEGFKKGVIYSLLPHSLCLGFIVFSIIGAVTATAFFRRLLLVPYFFHLLLAISLAFATASAIIYLQQNSCFSIEGIKSRGRYLLILYGTTVFINLLLLLVIFPLVTNIKLKNAPAVLSSQAKTSFLTLRVAIPCSGHAPLISGELQKIAGVMAVRFRLPNFFDIKFDQEKTSLEEILNLEVFQTYKAEVRE